MAKKVGSSKGVSKKKAAKKKAARKKAPASKGDAKKKKNAEDELTGTRLLDEFGEALLNVGSKASRLGGWGVKKVEEYGRRGVAKAESIGKLGVAKAELERARFSLANAYEALGEDIAAVWKKKPGAAVASDDEAVATSWTAVREHLKTIDEIQRRMKGLRGAKSK